MRTGLRCLVRDLFSEGRLADARQADGQVQCGRFGHQGILTPPLTMGTHIGMRECYRMYLEQIAPDELAPEGQGSGRIHSTERKSRSPELVHTLRVSPSKHQKAVSRDMVRPDQRRMDERDGVPVTVRLLRHRRHAVKFERRLKPELGAWNPAQTSVRDHEVSPCSTALQAAAIGDVFTTPDREDILVGVQLTADRQIAGGEKIAERGHAGRVNGPGCPRIRECTERTSDRK